MNDRVRIIRDGREHDVPLPDGIDFDLERMQARVVGHTIVLEPMPEGGGVAPGSYSSETLPPLSDKARAILASVDAAVAKIEAGDGAKAAGLRGAGVTLDDDGVPGFELSDEALPGLDPGPRV